MKSEWIVVGPKLAERWLATNHDLQRSLREGTVAKYAGDMKAGRWTDGWDAIAFDDDGKLVNGQHRLRAVIRSGVEVKFMVLHGVSRAAQETGDGGYIRTTANMIEREHKEVFGVAPKNLALVTAVANDMLFAGKGRNVSKIEIKETYMCHRTLIDDFSRVSKSSNGVANASEAAAFCNAARCFGRDKVDPLVERFSSQVWTGKRDPLKALYDRLTRDKVAKVERDSQRRRASRPERYLLAVSAIRAALLGADLLRVEPSARDFGEAPEDRKIGLTGQYTSGVAS